MTPLPFNTHTHTQTATQLLRELLSDKMCTITHTRKWIKAMIHALLETQMFTSE